MRVAVLTPRGFEIRDEKPPECGAGQVLVSTVGCGICEGDVVHYRSFMAASEADSALRSGTQSTSRRENEVVMGHEASGIVEAVGAGVRGFAPGDPVTALGGRYAELFVASPDNLVKLPPGVDPLWALGEPIACCVHAAARFGVRPGDRVAVIGCGFMGLVCLQLARLQGAAFAAAIEPLAWRHAAAKQLGADAALSPEGKSPQDLLRDLGEFDVVIEAAGVQPAIDISSELVRQHGRIILVGYHQTGGGLRTVNMKQWNFKAIDVVNGHVRRGDEKLDAMRRGMDLLASHDLVVEPLAQFYGLARTADAFRDLVARKEGLFKAVLVTRTE